MTSSTIEIQTPMAKDLAISADELTVKLSDGRAISVPLDWFPRLAHATPGERGNWRLIGQGEGVNWPDLDEDISVEGLIAGKPSAESKGSMRRWLKLHSGVKSRGSN